MRTVCTIWFLLMSCGLSVAQEGNISSLLAQAEEALYSDPQEAIRIAEYISEKTEEPVQLLQAAYLLSRGFYLEGNYSEALKIGLKFSEEELKDDTETQLQLNILLSKILNELEINTLAIKYGDKAKQLLKEDIDNNTRNWVEGKIIQYNLNNHSEDANEQTLGNLYKAKNNFEKIMSARYPFQIGNIDLDLAEMHLREFQLDSAQHYISSAFKNSKKEKRGNYLEMKSLVKYGDYLFLKKTPSEAIDTLKSAMQLAEKFSNLPEQILISEAIAENYLMLNDLKNFNIYNQKAEEISSAQGDVENEAVNTAYNFFNSNEAQKFKTLRATSKRNLLVLGGILLLLLFFWGFTKLRYGAKIKQYRKFLHYLERRKETVDSPALTKPETPRALNIPKEAEELLLAKLKEFENSEDFTNNEISLSRLALLFETNTKYLSEIINTHKQKNFNGYINELRINYIIEKLENDPKYLQYKISYLAEDSGFASHSVFTTVFKSVTGISPTTFIGILRNKQENSAA